MIKNKIKKKIRDLFHEATPSLNSLIKCQEILQKNVLGGNQIKYDIKIYKPNYAEENINIDLPIFMIHGNHDDPSGLEYLSNIDLMSSNNYVNYFGKVTNIEDIEVVPILFRKG